MSSAMATEEEENGWRAAAAACDDGKGLPLEEIDPDDKSDMEFVYQALNINNTGVKARLKRYMRKLRPLGPSQQTTTIDLELCLRTKKPLKISLREEEQTMDHLEQLTRARFGIPLARLAFTLPNGVPLDNDSKLQAISPNKPTKLVVSVTPSLISIRDDFINSIPHCHQAAALTAFAQYGVKLLEEQGRRCPSAAAASASTATDDRIEMEVEEETTPAKEEYRRLLFDDIGGLPPYSEKEGMVVLKPWRPNQKKRMEYYSIKKEYLDMISATEGVNAIKILHRVLVEMEKASPKDVTQLTPIVRYRKLKSTLRGSRHVLTKYLNAFAKHLYQCYGGDPIAYASENPHFSTKVENGKANRFHPNHGCCKCYPASEVKHQHHVRERKETGKDKDEARQES